MSLEFTNHLRKPIFSQTYPQVTKKCTKHPRTKINNLSIAFLDFWKYERDISIRPMWPENDFYWYSGLSLPRSRY